MEARAVEIRHKATGEILHRFETATLEGARLAGLYFCGADLSGVNLSGADLSGAICRATLLRGANLRAANLDGAYLLEADLRDADLTHARMTGASLDSTDLSGANLTGANLTGAYAADAKLTRTMLAYTNLQSAHLAGADVTGARLAFTGFADCVSLPDATGLEQVDHLAPSTLDLGTLRAGAARLPDVFLRGAGLAGEEIEALRALYPAPLPRPSCLLWHAEEDRAFAERLRGDLIARNVSCWRYRPDLHAGYLLQIVFDTAMRRHDRLVAVCSRHLLAHPDTPALLNVLTRREQDTGFQRLFPLRLDDSIASDSRDWLHGLRDRPMHDFRSIQEDRAYRAQVDRLTTALTTPTPL
jgi:uncharacterized protein YjbI with pentapeptide repeats